MDRTELSGLPKLFSKLIGRQKEDQAAHWLQSQKIKIVEQNFRCDRYKKGEIDLIGLDGSLKADSPTVVFIEVKYRKNCDHGHPLEFITPAQQKRIRRCAEVFLQKNRQYENYDCRFDVISFTADEEAQWIKNAF